MPTATADAHADASQNQDTAAATALILCGGLKPPPLASALNAPLLSLPQTADRTILQCWIGAFSRAGIEADQCRLLTDSNSWLGDKGRGDNPTTVGLIQDSGPYRGPAGVLRDAMDKIGSKGCCVIVESSRMLEAETALIDLIKAHRQHQDAVTVATNPDGSFAGLFVADPAVIDLIPHIGFIDIKEQWLPAARKEGFEIISHPLTGFCFSARTARGYLAALRRMGWFNLVGESHTVGRDAPGMFAKTYGGSLICRTAHVAPDAVVSCSAVGDRAEISPGAVVIRSIVGPRARVAKDDVIIDTVIPAADDVTH